MGAAWLRGTGRPTCSLRLRRGDHEIHSLGASIDDTLVFLNGLAAQHYEQAELDYGITLKGERAPGLYLQAPLLATLWPSAAAVHSLA
jgi:hypothetical protein